jgi:hypothetical protein
MTFSIVQKQLFFYLNLGIGISYHNILIYQMNLDQLHSIRYYIFSK